MPKKDISKEELIKENRNLKEKIEDLKAEQTSWESSSKFIKKIMQTTPNILYIFDLSTNELVYANDQIYKAIGYSPQEMIDLGSELLSKLLHPQDLERLREHDEKLKQSDDGNVLEIQFRIKHRDGSQRWLLSRECIFERNQQGIPVKKVGTAIDMTERNKSNEAINLKSEILESINKVFMESLRNESIEQLSKACLEIAEELSGANFGFIGEINPAGKFDTFAVSNPGWEACNIPETQKTRMILNMEIKGLWGQVIKEGKSYYTNNPAEHPASEGTPKDHPPLTSFLGVPLKQRDKVIGMIALGNKEGGFNPVDIEKIEAIAISIIESIRKKRAELTISQQSQEIIEVSTPVMQLWDKIVAAPLIGTLDSERTSIFMERLLSEIVKSNSEIAIVDITGVPAIDTQTAQHIIDTITAAKLLGAKVILSGVSPAIARTLVHLGIDLSEVETQSSLANSLKIALKIRQIKLVSNGK